MSSSNVKMYAVLAIVLVVSAAVVGVVLLSQPTPSITLVAFDGTQRNVTLGEMLGMETIERYGSFQNTYGTVKGQGNYTGVLIADLIELIGGMETDQVINVIGADEYQQYFTYANLYPNMSQYAIQGDFILAYSLNGTTIPSFEDGPRLMFLPADGYYSNEDGALTIDPQFYTGYAGPKLVSRAAKIVIAERPAPEEEILSVSVGGVTKNYTLSEIVEFGAINGTGGTKNKSGILSGPYNFTGVAVLDLLADIGVLPDDYNLTCRSSDDYEVIYNKTTAEGAVYGYDPDTGDRVGIVQSAMVLAYLQDDVTFDDGPLRIVLLNDEGYFTDSYLWAKMVVNLTVVEIEPEPEEDILSVTVGGVTEGYTLSEIAEFGATEGTGGTKNRYGTLKGPYNFTGVAVLDLLSEVGVLPENYNLTCLSSDEYEVIYNKTTTEGAVYGYDPNTGNPLGIVPSTMVLAYLQNGVPIDADGPLRIVFLNDDGYFTDSYLWAKMVVNLTVVEIGPDVLFINRGDTTLPYNLAEVMAMPSFSGEGGYKKSSGTLVGPNAYTGVTLQYLLSLTEEPLVNGSIEVISTDFYTTYYNMTQIEGWYSAYNGTTGVSVGIHFFTMVLAYERDGLPLTEDGPFRVVLLNEDGYFSDGHFWAKMASNITVLDSVESWTLELEGVDPYNMTHDTYYSLASCPHHRIVISTEGHTYWGVALWVLVAAMDGGDDTHYTFNVTLAIAGYNVTLYDSLGANVTFTVAQLAQNSSIIVAGWVDGLLPNGPDWPLILVTPDGVLLSNIVRIEMTLY